MLPLGEFLLQKIVSWIARSQGFLDPVEVWAQLRRFGRPTEVIAPTELLRSGAVLHARGLINSQAIQHNLDWVWPHWVARQFDPSDPAFIPRAFSLTHINLTHRNWTAVGLPDVDELPLVDPRGLVTPHYDGWSLDGWLVQANSQPLVPSRAKQVVQELLWESNLSVRTTTKAGAQSLITEAMMVPAQGSPACRMRLEGKAGGGRAWLVLALRPYNPEGISFIRQVSNLPDGRGWLVNKKQRVLWDARPDQILFSRYAAGDVYYQLNPAEAPPQLRPEETVPEDATAVEDDVGMVTAAAIFALPANAARAVTIDVPLNGPATSTPARAADLPSPEIAWAASVDGACRLEGADPQWQFLYDAAVRSLILHAPGDVYPGPYTYKRFWFRDAAFIINALISLGLFDRAERALDRFPEKQSHKGYFRSQHGEWDSNGQVLWIYQRFCEFAGRLPKPQWIPPIEKGAKWLLQARPPAKSGELHAGLLPPGFSAEHFGPNDYYYWDDFWGVAGQRAAADLLGSVGQAAFASTLRSDAALFMEAIERSLAKAAQQLGHKAMPISPYRRMDAAAIGMLCVSYPLQLWAPDDARVAATAEFLLANCLVDGGFFQNMSHSGVNPYLTLHLAQERLRAGDTRWAWDLAQTIARLASPTGQWPEAVHPGTKGGCMGDGQHIWAAAEWVLFIRNCFVDEEGGKLILCRGIPESWLTRGHPVRFGPAPTRFGPISITIHPDAQAPRVEWTGRWHKGEPPVEVRLPRKAAA